MASPTKKRKPPPIEPRILQEVYEAAQERARQQGQALAAVARMILFAEAARTPEGAKPPESRPPLRKYNQKRTRLRLVVRQESYHVARDKIHSGGRTVASALEDGLRHYAITGKIQ